MTFSCVSDIVFPQRDDICNMYQENVWKKNYWLYSGDFLLHAKNVMNENEQNLKSWDLLLSFIFHCLSKNEGKAFFSFFFVAVFLLLQKHHHPQFHQARVEAFFFTLHVKIAKAFIRMDSMMLLPFPCYKRNFLSSVPHKFQQKKKLQITITSKDL